MLTNSNYRRRAFVNDPAFRLILQRAYPERAICGVYYERQGRDEFCDIVTAEAPKTHKMALPVSVDITDMELPELMIAVIEALDRHFRKAGAS